MRENIQTKQTVEDNLRSILMYLRNTISLLEDCELLPASYDALQNQLND